MRSTIIYLSDSSFFALPHCPLSSPQASSQTGSQFHAKSQAISNQQSGKMVSRKRHQYPWLVYLYGIAPCTGGLAFGYDTGSMSGILAMPQFLHYMKDPGNFTQGGITASIQAGAFAGSLLTGAFLADQIGRKRTILLGSAIFTIGIAISTAANGVPALVAGRVINGLGNGCLAMMVPLCM